VAVSDEPSGASAPPPGSDLSDRLARLEVSYRRLRVGLAVAVVGGLGAAFATLEWMERRHLTWRADTIVARRFVVQDSGRVRAELGIDAHGWAVMRLGLDERGVPGVAAGVSPSRGSQFFVQSSDGRKILLMSSTIMLDGGGGIRAALGADRDSAYLILNREGANTRLGPTSHRTYVYPSGDTHGQH